MLARITALLTSLFGLICSAAPACANTIDVARLGPPSFDERWQSFDHGIDQVRPARPHRWRTVLGHGGPLSVDNRKMSGTSLAVDRFFTGIRNEKPGLTALGLDPFVHRPGRMLSIQAQRTPSALRPWLFGMPYYSGQITTKFSFSQRFGYFEIEARLPKGKGMWPAFWLMPTQGAWPRGGEIDIMEGLGDPHELYFTVISADRKTQQTKVRMPFDVSAGFHQYGASWGPKEIIWYVDRKEVARKPTPPEINTPMYMIVNLAVGGSWGGHPDARTVFPGVYDIRRVTAWKQFAP